MNKGTEHTGEPEVIWAALKFTPYSICPCDAIAVFHKTVGQA